MGRGVRFSYLLPIFRNYRFQCPYCMMSYRFRSLIRATQFVLTTYVFVKKWLLKIPQVTPPMGNFGVKRLSQAHDHLLEHVHRRRSKAHNMLCTPTSSCVRVVLSLGNIMQLSLSVVEFRLDRKSSAVPARPGFRLSLRHRQCGSDGVSCVTS